MAEKQVRGPLRAVMNIRRAELPLALLMFSYFFLVITTFWILKPIKKTIFIGFYETRTFEWLGPVWNGPQAELVAKVMNMFVAYLAVVLFSALAKNLRRQQLTFVFSAFFLSLYVAYSFALNAPSEGIVWSFYLFGDAFSTIMVATFFAFLNDSVTPEKAKRIYGLVGLGGVSGGTFGSMFVRGLISDVETATWMWICFGIGVAIIIVAYAAGRLVDREPPPDEPARDASDEPRGGNPAIEGARLVFRSRYLLSVVAIVGLYEIVSTVMDFQFTATLDHFLDGPAFGEHLTTVYTATNAIAMLVQLLLTSFVMTRFGVGTALLVLPIAAMGGSVAFMMVPALLFGSLLNTADNAFSYSINQSAKEALYVPTTRDEKYKAKAFIDMFVQRFAKAIAVGVSLGITTVFADFSSVRWLSLFTVLVTVLWILAARYAGRHFREVTEGRS